MELYCRVMPESFVPLDDIDWEQKKQIKIGSDVKIRITMPRNIKFHRKFFALLNIAFENLPEKIQAEKNIDSVDRLLQLVKIHLGYYEVVKVGESNVLDLHSISFAKMDETEFRHFYDLAVNDILRCFLQGTEKEDLLREVELFIGKN